MKKISMFFAMVMTVAVLAACGQTFDATGFVRGALDTTTKGDFKEYVKLSDTTEEKAKKMYEDSLDDAMKSFDSIGLSSELTGKYRDLYKEMYKKTKYTVGEAKEDKDKNYTVKVDVEPLLVFEDFQDELTTFQEEYTEKIQKDILAGKDMPTDEEMYNDMFTKIYDLLNKKVEKPTYGKKETIEVKVEKKSDDSYEFSKKEFEKINEKLIDTDSAAF